MITRKPVKSEKDSYFAPCWSLYEEAFPREERRKLNYQLDTLEREEYHFEALINECGEFVGFIAWWEFATLRFIEHLATTPASRGRGYGKEVLESFMHESTSPVLLEVEHPHNELAARRIKFYERLGFILNPHSYAQPPMDLSTDEYLSLLVMTYPHPINKQELKHFKTNYFPKIHFKLTQFK